MHIGVITPYYKEPIEMIRRCYDSVQAQTLQNLTHIIVSDGFPNPQVDDLPGVVHIRVPNHADYGDTPRMIGAAHAVNRGFDAVAFLDADNWYEPDHIEQLVRQMLTGRAAVVTATRHLWTDQGRSLGVCTECDGVTHVDTNCFLVTQPAFHLLGVWGFKDRALSISGDRIFWKAVQDSGLRYSHCPKPTVNYTTTFAAHYLRCGEEPPLDSKINVRMPDGSPAQITFEQWRRIQAIEA
jgi:glycosyltransferase involved in cell wall biosynthesis